MDMDGLLLMQHLGYGEVEDTEQSSTQDESERQSQSDNSNSSVDENMTVDDTDEPGY